MTDGAIEAHDRGIVTACSVVAGGPDLPRAAELLRARPDLEVGLHFCLAGAPLVSDEARSLSPRGSPFGGYAGFLVAWLRGSIDRRDVERELRAQLDRLRAAGLRPNHVNGHQHLHVLPGVAEIVGRVSREEGLLYVRVPDEPVVPAGPRAAAVWILALFARRARVLFRRAGLVMNDRAIGLVHAGHLTTARIASELRRAVGVTELVTHPGSDNEIGRTHEWGYDWDGERRALIDPATRAEIVRRRLRLIRPSEAAALPVPAQG